ncbi:very-short-patch-repair endonuclease [Nakamurella sp. UYEF19]|uniref:DUF559 domain-containing protein n=1 Tax=Nakamurella sp. UYEF19 TaxID=1756392 RepID=UPI003396538F
MYTRKPVPPGLIRLAGAQAGVVSRPQVIGFGLPDNVVDRLIVQGIWGRLESGIYLVPDVEPSWLAMVWAGLMIGGADARAAGPTAAALQGLTDERTLPLDVLVPVGTRLAAREWVVFRQERAGVRSISTRSEPPCTRVEDTVLDLCAAGSPAACVEWITSAIQRRLTTADALSRAMQRRARMRHRKVMIGVIADAASGVHSSLEHSYLHQVELAHSLAEGRRQRGRPGGAGFIDVTYEKFALVVELDGRIGHVGEGKLRDSRRDNHHTAKGMRTLRYGWHEVTQEPCAVAMEVAEVLLQQGWTGYPTRCPSCLG